MLKVFLFQKDRVAAHLAQRQRLIQRRAADKGGDAIGSLANFVL